MKKVLILFFLVSISIYNYSQVPIVVDSLKPELGLNKTETFDIPELSVCIESALKNSPLLKANQEQIEIILEDIKIKKKSWLEYLIIDANTRYGLFNQVTLTQETSSPDLAIQSNKEQFNYFAGITLRIPFSYFVNNKSEQKKLKLNIKEAELKKEDLKIEINKLVVVEYFKFKRLQELLGVHLNNLQTAQIDYLKSKNDLKSGMLTMTEFAASSTAYAKAVDAFVSVKNDYYAQYYIFNILIGTNIQNDKK